MRTLLLLIGFLLVGSRLQAVDVFLGTSKEPFKKFPIGVLPFQEMQGAFKGSPQTQEVALAVFRADLIRSQLFDLIDFPQKGATADLTSGPNKTVKAWAKESGALGVAWAKLYPSGDRWVLEAYAYETGQWTPVIRVKITAESIRPLAHRFSDKLVAYFTGETGLAQSKIAYLSDRTGRKEIYLMDYDGANEIKLTAERAMIPPPRWSDATHVGYTSYRQGRSEVYLLDLESGRRQKILTSQGLIFAPAWSSSSGQALFASTQAGNAELYMMQSHGEALKRLTFHAAADLSPSWSPTGAEIAFTSDRGGSPQIYIMDKEGGNVRRLTSSGSYNTSASWSPRGDWVAYTCRNSTGVLKLCARRADGQQSLEITREGEWDDEFPSWAPNGREIVFTSNRHGKYQIFTIRPDGTGLVQLTEGAGNNTSPVWSPR